MAPLLIIIIKCHFSCHAFISIQRKSLFVSLQQFICYDYSNLCHSLFTVSDCGHAEHTTIIYTFEAWIKLENVLVVKCFQGACLKLLQCSYYNEGKVFQPLCILDDRAIMKMSLSHLTLNVNFKNIFSTQKKTCLLISHLFLCFIQTFKTIVA